MRYDKNTMQQEYFEKYIMNVRGLSPKTASNYHHALMKIAKVLKEKGWYAFESLYEIDSYAELKELEATLMENTEFVELDERGKNMYTAGLHNYMQFIEGEHFKRVADPLRLLDSKIPVAPKRVQTAREVANRDHILVRQVLMAEQYTCLCDASHTTFTAARTRSQYMEGHHLIPMKAQDDFDYSIDVYANIVCLCPTCHRLLHHGIKEEKKPALNHLFDLRRDRLVDSGIRLGKKEFLELVEHTCPDDTQTRARY